MFHRQTNICLTDKFRDEGTMKNKIRLQCHRIRTPEKVVGSGEKLTSIREHYQLKRKLAVYYS